MKISHSPKPSPPIFSVIVQMTENIDVTGVVPSDVPRPSVTDLQSESSGDTDDQDSVVPNPTPSVRKPLPCRNPEQNTVYLVLVIGDQDVKDTPWGV